MSHLYSIPRLAYFRARNTPDKTIIYDYDTKTEYTCKDIFERSSRLAGYLRKVLHVNKGDRVGFIAKNDTCFIETFYASCMTGIVITAYNGRLKDRELIKLVNSEEPKIMFFSEVFREKAIGICKDAQAHIIPICIEEVRSIDNNLCYKDIMDSGCTFTEDEYEDIDIEDAQMLMHTGGTTGAPKAAVISFRAIFMNSISEILTWQLNDSDSAPIVMPFFHTGGWNLLMLPLLLTGGKIILAGEFNVDTFFDITENCQPTLFMGVEPMLKAIANNPRFEKADLTSYKWLINGGAPIARATLEPYWARGVRVFNGYGMTEIGPHNLTPDVVNTTLETNIKKGNACGKPFLFTDCRIVDSSGNDVEPGVRGELIWRGDLLFSGYWQNDAAIQEVYKDGWVYSGDVGYQDDDGDIYVCDRTKNMYISYGENIYPAEIEAVISRHPDILDVCVIGITDTIGLKGEVGKALIVRRPDATVKEEDLSAFFKEQLSSISRPQFIEFIESIPKNSVGKRDLNAIRNLYGNAEQ
jgi:fatty-acyl-CoA synthase